jgi:hypothetical protein
MDTARWIDLTDPEGEGEGEGERGALGSRARGLGSSWTSAPLRDVARTAVRNEQSHAAVLEALQSLREAAGRGGTVVAGAASVGARGSSGGDSAAAGTAAPGPLLARASAFAQRLTTAQRLMAQSSLRGSPSSAAERIAAAFVGAVRAASAEAERYPGAVRAVSSRTLNEMRQLLDAGTREASAAAMEVERAAAAFRAEHSAQGDAARREAERTALALRDRVAGSEAVAQLRRDVAEAARLSGAASRAGVSDGPEDPYAALPGHLDALRRAAAPEAIEREAECAALAFRGFVEALRGARASPRTVPQALLDQVSSADRRREMAAMPADRARTLLEHTRRAIAREEASGAANQGGAISESLRKLRVVASILAIRARGEEDSEGGSGSAGSALAHLGRRWSMRGSDVLRGLERVAASARLAAEIAARSEAARGDTVGRMRAVLARTVGDAARRVAQGSESKSQRWRDEVCGAYASGEAALLREGQQLADAVTAGLELFVGTGLLIGPDGGGGDDAEDGAEEDDEADVALVPVSSWRRAREMRSDAFAVPEEGEGLDGFRARSPDPTGARQLLRKTHALALEGFVAWVEYASAVLLTNAAGTVRASGALREALDPARRRFEELVRSQMGGGGGTAKAS